VEERQLTEQLDPVICHAAISKNSISNAFHFCVHTFRTSYFFPKTCPLCTVPDAESVFLFHFNFKGLDTVSNIPFFGNIPGPVNTKKKFLEL
jgi:hypothetical protein